MSHLHKWALAFILISTIAWSQTPTSQQGNSTEIPTSAKPENAFPTPGDSTALELIKSQKADYPMAASQRGIQGQVWVKLMISQTGDVEDVEVISGDPILAESAVKASKKFKFKPFIRNGHAVKASTKVPFNFFFSDKVFNKGVAADGSTVSQTSPPPDKTGNTPNKVRVGQGVAQGMLVHQIAPVYPPDARRRGIQGSVVLAAIIGKDGAIKDLQVVSGPPQLIPAALGAVQQWRYKPYTLEGEPVEVETQITVNFRLSRW